MVTVIFVYKELQQASVKDNASQASIGMGLEEVSTIISCKKYLYKVIRTLCRK